MSSRHARMLRPQDPLIVFIVLDFWKEERRQGAIEGLAETMCMTGSRSRRGWVMLSGAGFSLLYGLESGRLLEPAFQPQMEMVLIRAHFTKGPAYP